MCESVCGCVLECPCVCVCVCGGGSVCEGVCVCVCVKMFMTHCVFFPAQFKSSITSPTHGHTGGISPDYIQQHLFRYRFHLLDQFFLLSHRVIRPLINLHRAIGQDHIHKFTWVFEFAPVWINTGHCPRKRCGHAGLRIHPFVVLSEANY